MEEMIVELCKLDGILVAGSIQVVLERLSLFLLMRQIMMMMMDILMSSMIEITHLLDQSIIK
jgi:hypothetical protein